MFATLGTRGSVREIFFRHLISGQFTNLDQLQLTLQLLYERRLEQREEEEEETIVSRNNNPNFLKEKDINYKNYPLYLNWKKIESNESEFYLTLSHFGYFGAHIYSTFKTDYPRLKTKNIFETFATFIKDFINEPKKVKEFIDKLPKLKEISEIIKDKTVLFKEVPMFLIVLKILEIYWINKKNEKKEELVEVLKNEYLLISYLSEEEYKNLFDEYFKGKTHKIFKELGKKYGKIYFLPKSKNQFFEHLKFIFQNKDKENFNIIDNENNINIIQENVNASHVEHENNDNVNN